MEATTAQQRNPIVLPGTVKILSERVDYAVRIYEIEETEEHTDSALMSYVGCKPYLGGRVTRYAGGRTLVYRHTS